MKYFMDKLWTVVLALWFMALWAILVMILIGFARASSGTGQIGV